MDIFSFFYSKVLHNLEKSLAQALQMRELLVTNVKVDDMTGKDNSKSKSK